MQYKMLTDWVPLEPYQCHPIMEGDILDVWISNGSSFGAVVPWMETRSLLALIPREAAEVHDPRTYFVFYGPLLLGRVASINEARSVRNENEGAFVNSYLGCTSFDIMTGVLEIDVDGTEFWTKEARNAPAEKVELVEGMTASEYIQAQIKANKERVKRSAALLGEVYAN